MRHGVLIFEATGIFLFSFPVRYGVFIYESTRRNLFVRFSARLNGLY